MKKILALGLVLAVMAPYALAQKRQDSNLERKVSAAVRSQTEQNSTKKILKIVENMRNRFKEMKKEDASFVLQSLVGMYGVLVDEYSTNKEYAINGAAFLPDPKKEESLRIVCTEINRPLETGWNEKILISQYIVDNIDQVRSKWMSDGPIGALYEMNALLNQYALITKNYSVQGQNTAEIIEVWKKYVRNMKEENPSYVLQQAINVCEALNEIRDAKEYKELKEQLNEPIQAGWGEKIQFTPYVVDHHTEVDWYHSSLMDEIVHCAGVSRFPR